jgi:hypothetical protein
VKRTSKTVTLENKTLVIRKMEVGKIGAIVCHSLSSAQATVSTVVVNAEKIKQSAPKITKLHMSNVSYNRKEKMEQLHYRLMTEIKKEIFSLSVLLLQKFGVFLMKFNKKKVEKGHSLLAKDGLQGSRNTCKFIAKISSRGC